MLDLHPDEAYYWQMSCFMDWGYFHQPPMVAVFIKLGYAIFQNEFGVRLVTLLASTIGMLLMFKLSNTKASQNFILIFSGFILTHAGTFMAVPDSPLVFFTIVFLVVLREYLRADSYTMAIGLGLLSAILMYSKYHSIVLFASVIIALPKLLLRKSFWITVVIGFLAFTPHILWQFDNDLISFKYHWLRRNKSGWEPSLVLNYIGSQLLLFGPLGLLLAVSVFKQNSKDEFERVLRFVFVGFLLFFFVLSLRGRVEANWTATAFVALIILATKALENKLNPKWFRPVSMVTLLVILIARVYLISPIAGEGLKLNHTISGWSNWAKAIKEKADDKPVFFSATYQLPSLYSFYSGDQGYHFSPVNYDGNQFDIWQIDTAANNLDIALVLPIGEDPEKAVKVEGFRTFYVYNVPNYKSYRLVHFKTETEQLNANPADSVIVAVMIQNNSNESINLDSLTAVRPIQFITYQNRKHQQSLPVTCANCTGVLAVDQTKDVSFSFPAPNKKGDYLVRFGFYFAWGMPEQNSEFIQLKVINE